MRENICYPTLEETQSLLAVKPERLREVLREKVVIGPEGFSYERDNSLQLPDRTRLAPGMVLYAAFRLNRKHMLELAANLVSYAVDNDATDEELDLVDDQIENFFEGMENFHALERKPITMAEMERVARGKLGR